MASAVVREPAAADGAEAVGAGAAAVAGAADVAGATAVAPAFTTAAGLAVSAVPLASVVLEIAGIGARDSS